MLVLVALLTLSRQRMANTRSRWRQRHHHYGLAWNCVACLCDRDLCRSTLFLSERIEHPLLTGTPIFAFRAHHRKRSCPAILFIQQRSEEALAYLGAQRPALFALPRTSATSTAISLSINTSKQPDQTVDQGEASWERPRPRERKPLRRRSSSCTSGA